LKASKLWKPLDDSEFIIVDIKEGTGNWAGKAKIISLSGELDGRHIEFDGTFKGQMPRAIEVLAEKEKWIGKVVTVYYNGLTGLGIPNFCQWNPDECDKGDR